jgi:hypothetical protein
MSTQTDAVAKGLPDYEALMEQGFLMRENLADQWHQEPSEGPDGVTRWYWHASQLAKCPRGMILGRASLATDPIPLDGYMAMEVGNAFHKVMEDFLDVTPEALGLGGIEVISVEKGGAHKRLPLKAKPDHILRINEQPVVCDIKSEAGSAVKMRLNEQKATKSYDAVRHAHKLQIAAGAMVAESLGMYTGTSRLGLVVYISRQIGKNKWDFSVETFEITQELRHEVIVRVCELDQAWENWVINGIAPDCLPMEMRFGKLVPNWMCARHAEAFERIVQEQRAVRMVTA